MAIFSTFGMAGAEQSITANSAISIRTKYWLRMASSSMPHVTAGRRIPEPGILRAGVLKS
jgi:hypothetical protein